MKVIGGTGRVKFKSSPSFVRAATELNPCESCLGKKGLLYKRFGYWLHHKCAPSWLRTHPIPKQEDSHA